MDVQVRTSQSDYPASVAESEELPTGNESAIQNIGSYADIGLVKSGSLYSSEQQLKNPESLSNFGVSLATWIAFSLNCEADNY